MRSIDEVIQRAMQRLLQMAVEDIISLARKNGQRRKVG